MVLEQKFDLLLDKIFAVKLITIFKFVSYTCSKKYIRVLKCHFDLLVPFSIKKIRG